MLSTERPAAVLVAVSNRSGPIVANLCSDDLILAEPKSVVHCAATRWHQAGQGIRIHVLSATADVNGQCAVCKEALHLFASKGGCMRARAMQPQRPPAGFTMQLRIVEFTRALQRRLNSLLSAARRCGFVCAVAKDFASARLNLISAIYLSGSVYQIGVSVRVASTASSITALRCLIQKVLWCPIPSTTA